MPVLIVAAGQLGGGLAWLAVSGEDAPELIASAPVSAARVLRAKTEAVLGGIAMVFAPFVVVLAARGAVRGAGRARSAIAIAAGSATAIQFWFRTQARRSLFRRRQTSSRVATYRRGAVVDRLGRHRRARGDRNLARRVPRRSSSLAIVGGAWMISPNRKASGR